MTLAGLQRRFLIATGMLPLTALALCGCSTVAGSHAVTLVRVIDASYNAPALDAYVSTTPIAVNFAGPAITNYAFVPPGPATMTLYPTGKKSVAAQVAGTLGAGEEHSIYITDSESGYQATLLTDQTTAGPGGAISVRFLQQALSTGAVDIYFIPDGSKIAQAKPIVTNLAAGSLTAYINLPAGTYTVAVAPTGTTTTAYLGASTAFTAGQVRTMLIVDQQLLNTPPVKVIVGDDLN